MYCLDTNIVVAFLRGDAEVAEKIRNNEVCITWLTVCELYRGIFLSRQAVSNKAQLERFLEVIKIIEFNQSACELYGAQHKELKITGSPTQDIDLLISALCIANNKILVTRNIKHFKKVHNLKVISW
ncbi:MAG TPA: type II toxin-antitoxin system VapC family toxin [Candidatus Nanoarchaeia archaeon]|nr:type II toxin-antitoxin system VapC family toxin [Candidatus Nanoarchaeia archaeon]